MLASARTVAFVPSTDLGRSRAFYESVLGLPVVSADGFAVVVDGPGGLIRITDVGSALRVQSFTVLGWEVEDVAAEVDELLAGGVEFLRYPGLDHDDRGVWTAPGGARVAWFHDPDGNTLSLSQPA
ncbi:VOC family protein [Actinoplanes sp. KI2]|uniref:VOC family protein n=1 Tax=Actinoplanes sp. KI2 TaxID=2983315 RepID=UPI0021D5CF7A|nr:VOC family protein [Actinoplanes sp. KI2]MCU7730352.1 VOC family protein [Actinoplanes sp. KI2]